MILTTFKQRLNRKLGDKRKLFMALQKLDFSAFKDSLESVEPQEQRELSPKSLKETLTFLAIKRSLIEQKATEDTENINRIINELSAIYESVVSTSLSLLEEPNLDQSCDSVVKENENESIQAENLIAPSPKDLLEAKVKINNFGDTTALMNQDKTKMSQDKTESHAMPNSEVPQTPSTEATSKQPTYSEYKFPPSKHYQGTMRASILNYFPKRKTPPNAKEIFNRFYKVSHQDWGVDKAEEVRAELNAVLDRGVADSVWTCINGKYGVDA